MIKRNRGSNPNMNQLLSEDSFTNKKGIDVTQAPPMRDFVLDANNLDVSLDGSMTLRKPLIDYFTYTGYIKETYIPNRFININNNSISISSSDTYSVKLRYSKDSVTETIDFVAIGLDFSTASTVNASTSTILYNVRINLLEFASGIFNPGNLNSPIVNGYFRCYFEESDFIMEYIHPYISNLEGANTLFNPNTAGYYTYAVRDSYNAAVMSVNNILAYDVAQKVNGEWVPSINEATNTVSDLTETDMYDCYIINSITKNDITSRRPIMLKAFCNFSTLLAGAKYYGCWEYTTDGVSYIEVPEFTQRCLNNPNSAYLKVVDNSRSKETTEGTEYVYRYIHALNMASVSDEKDILNTRPDVLYLPNGISQNTYRFTIYRVPESYNVNVTSRTITKLSNLSSSYTTMEETYRVSKTDNVDKESFSVSYTLTSEGTIDFSTITGKIYYKDTLNGNINSANLVLDTSESSGNTAVIKADSLTIPVTSLSGTNYLYNVRQFQIVLYLDNVLLDTIKYTVLLTYGRLTDLNSTSSRYATKINSNIELNQFDEDRYSFNCYETNSNDFYIVDQVGTIPISGSDQTYYIPDMLVTPISNFASSPYYYELTPMASSTLSYLSSEQHLGDLAVFIASVKFGATDYVFFNTGYGNGFTSNLTANNNTNPSINAIADMLAPYTANAYNTKIYGNTNRTLNIFYDVYTQAATSGLPGKLYSMGAGNEYIITDSIISSEVSLLRYIQGTSPTIKANINQSRLEPSVDLYTPNSSELIYEATSLSFIPYTINVGSLFESLNKDFINTVKGEKLYHNYRLYTYGEEEFKNCIYVTDSNSFITSLLNTIDLPMSQDSKVTALVPWRDYLIAASENNLFLVTPVEDGFTSKLVNTFIGIPSKDSKTLKSILNGVVFKSGSKIYSLQPSVYATDDNILNIIDISKPIAPYIEDTAYDNFAFTTEQFYCLCIPNTNSTLMLKYEYATKIWTKHTYNTRFLEAVVNTVDDIHIIGTDKVYIYGKTLDDAKLIELPYPIDPYCDAQYGDLVVENNKYVPYAFEFYVDTGQKSYSMNNIKQFVESKLIFAILDNNDSIPLDVDIYVDNYTKILHMDPSTSSAFWRKMESMILGTDIPAGASQYQPCIKQLFLRYSGKGYTIRHRISGLSYSNFKFYVSYYRYKSTINKH